MKPTRGVIIKIFNALCLIMICCGAAAFFISVITLIGWLPARLVISPELRVTYTRAMYLCVAAALLQSVAGFLGIRFSSSPERLEEISLFAFVVVLIWVAVIITLYAATGGIEFLAVLLGLAPAGAFMLFAALLGRRKFT